MTPLSSWVEHAACAGLPVHIFFSALHNKDVTKRAKAVCSTCPVRRECGEFGKDERFGIWGGMTPRERNKNFRSGNYWVDAIGSTRRLRALAVLGYGSAHLARELDARGWVVPTRHGLTWIRETGVRTDTDTADIIAELYTDLVKRGPNTEARAITARKAAAAERWHGPEAWTDLTIDDPKAKPLPPTNRPTPHQFSPAATHPTHGIQRRLQALARLGYGTTQLAALLDDRGHRVTHATLASLLHGAIERTTRERADAIRDLYEHLAGGPRSNAPRAHLTAAKARGAGWPAPGDWEGLDIDDPFVQARQAA